MLIQILWSILDLASQLTFLVVCGFIVEVVSDEFKEWRRRIRKNE
jgi:hypothetical protein